MNAQLAELGFVTIQMTYPGGIEAFLEAGGKASYDSEALYFFHPSPPKHWMQALSAIKNLRIKLVTTKNFGESSDVDQVISGVHQVIKKYHSLLQEKGIMAGVSIDPVILRVLIAGKHADRKLAEEIIEDLRKNVTDLVRICIAYGIHPETDYVLYEGEPSQKTILSEQRPNRDRIITKDEVTDLKIMLGKAKSIDDFLANL